MFEFFFERTNNNFLVIGCLFWFKSDFFIFQEKVLKLVLFQL